MRTMTTVATLAASLAFSACGPDGARGELSTEPANLGIAASHHSNGARPLKGSCEVTSTEVVSFNPPVLQQIGNATCHVAHLGRITVRTEQTINVATGAQTGTATWTAANGDLVFLTSEGTSEPAGQDLLSFSGTATITGGTGRFEQSAGQFDVAGTANISNGSGTFTYRGAISY